MNTDEKRIAVLMKADRRDARRYRKLQAWCLEHHVELWPSWGTPYESFDAAVDALQPASAQEPERDA